MKKNIKKLYNHRLHNLHIMVKLLSLAPYVRCVILNGSMATGEIKTSSDIDLLIIAKSKRIYTCRAAVLFWACFSGLKRSNKIGKTHAGRFCFNYFLTEDFLIIPHNRGEKVDKYCAINYSKSVLLWGDKNIFDKYMRINWEWMKKYLPQISNLKSQNYNSKFKTFCHSELDSGSTNSRLRVKPRMTEQSLSGRFGDWLEKVLKNIQVKRITKDPASKKYPKYIVYNDQELRFHLPQKR